MSGIPRLFNRKAVAKSRAELGLRGKRGGQFTRSDWLISSMSEGTQGSQGVI